MLLRLIQCLLALTLLAFGAGAVTLERLSLEEMIDSSTLIVRGTIRESEPSRTGQLIETVYRVNVSEYLKGKGSSATSRSGSAGGSLLVSLPGGEAGGLQQVFAGVPKLEAGTEYVLFLWRSGSGRLLLVGMSQGVLRIRRANGHVTAERPPIDGTMLDRNTGRAVRDSGVGMRLPALQEAVSRRVASAKGGRQ